LSKRSSNPDHRVFWLFIGESNIGSTLSVDALRTVHVNEYDEISPMK
jgi:hypothetical protein